MEYVTLDMTPGCCCSGGIGIIIMVCRVSEEERRYNA
jgi:hypothetical protein